MKKGIFNGLVIVTSMVLMISLWGCGSSSTTSKAVPSDNLTGDTSMFPNNDLIASAQYLLDNGASNVNASANSTPIIIDTRSAAAYALGHIPGAINTEWGNFVVWNEPPEKAVLQPVAALETTLGSLGVTREATIVIYDDTLASWGSSGRIFWMLEYLGCTHVKILNGGWDKWEADKLPAQTSVNVLAPAVFTAVLNTDINPDKDHILDRMGDSDFVTVDTRTDAEFNGWTLYGEARGGHISGAVHLPYEWYFNSDHSILGYADLQDLFDSHGISDDKEIVPYCTAGIRSGFFYYLARLMGYDRVSNYDASMWDWAAANSAVYPMEALAHYERLVYPALVNQMMAEEPDLVIVETGWGPVGDNYNSGHLPGAVWVNTDEIEYDCFNPRDNWPVDAGDPPCWDRSTTMEEDLAKGLTPGDALPRNWWNIYPDQYLLPAIAYMGIQKDTPVIVYGEDVTAAARIISTLMYAGVEDVRLLNGGKTAWTTAGFPLSTEPAQRVSLEEFDPDTPGRTTAIYPEYKSEIPHVREVVNGDVTDAVIVDVRSMDEYLGKSAPYGYIPTDGRIPGAVWGLAGSSPWTMEDYTDDQDTTLRSYEEIKTFWVSQGLTPDKHLSFYCGTGWRSSLAWFYAYLMGYPQVSNFDSGWFEWSMGEGSAYAGADPVLNPIVDDDPTLP
jgi:thiosulfate/3-mercaptopyruvate sulfurtransferase